MQQKQQRRPGSTSTGAEAITIDGYPVTGRAAAMIRWLADHQAEVNGGDKGEMVFSLAGGTVAPRFLRHYPPIAAGE